MNDEALNMSIRKFLKTVGVNSQLAIEKAVQNIEANAGGPVRMSPAWRLGAARLSESVAPSRPSRWC